MGIDRYRGTLAVALGFLLVSCSSDTTDQTDRKVAGRGATFVVTYSDTPLEAQLAFESAARIWGARLVSKVPIRVRVSFIPLTTRALCLPNPLRDFEGAANKDAWYPASLANSIAGWDLQPGDNDMEIFFSTMASWHFEGDGEARADESDFSFVALHEICHGLGFASFLKVQNGVGSYGGNVFERLPPISFSLPDLAGLPSVFDLFVENESGQRLVDPSVFPSPSRKLGLQLAKNSLYFGGPNAARRHNHRRPRLDGTDPSHLDRQFYEASDTNGMMTPGPVQPAAVLAPGPIMIGVLEDLGWTINEPAGGAWQ